MTSGPVMRSTEDSELWLEWMVRVQKADENSSIISLQAFVGEEFEDDARCLGYVSTFYNVPGYEGTCALPPYGTGVFLNESQDASSDSNPQQWMVRPSRTTGEWFELVATSKPDACARVLAAVNCTRQTSLVEESLTVSAEYHTSWKFTRKYELVPPSPPPPSPPPPTPPPPTGPIPGPRIDGPSSTSTGNIQVVVTELPQSDLCSASSVVFEYTPAAVGSIQQTLEVPVSSASPTTLPLSEAGYYMIYAYAKCTNGKVTDRSNALTVFSVVLDNRVCRIATGATTDWGLGCGTESCTNVCASLSKVCNATGARSMDSEAKGTYVAGLFNLQLSLTYYDEVDWVDAPVMDVSEGGIGEMFWNGTVSECDVPGLFPELNQTTVYPISRRFCCCGNNCPVQ